MKTLKERTISRTVTVTVVRTTLYDTQQKTVIEHQVDVVGYTSTPEIEAYLRSTYIPGATLKLVDFEVLETRKVKASMSEELFYSYAVRHEVEG